MLTRSSPKRLDEDDDYTMEISKEMESLLMSKKHIYEELSKIRNNEKRNVIDKAAPATQRGINEDIKHMHGLLNSFGTLDSDDKKS